MTVHTHTQVSPSLKDVPPPKNTVFLWKPSCPSVWFSLTLAPLFSLQSHVLSHYQMSKCLFLSCFSVFTVSSAIQGSSAQRLVTRLVAVEQMFKGQSLWMCPRQGWWGVGRQQLTSIGHLDWKGGLVFCASEWTDKGMVWRDWNWLGFGGHRGIKQL